MHRDFAQEIVEGYHDCNAVQSTNDEWQLNNIVVSHVENRSPPCMAMNV